jgi:hypothetical protein
MRGLLLARASCPKDQYLLMGRKAGADGQSLEAGAWLLELGRWLASSSSMRRLRASISLALLLRLDDWAGAAAGAAGTGATGAATAGAPYP